MKDLRTENYLKNQQEITLKKTILESLPRSLVVSLTNRCNLKCPNCEVWSKVPWDISPATVQEIIDWIPYLEHITWQGGEVFLSEYFEELFDIAAAQESLSQNIPSNALLIDEAWAKKLSAADVNLILSIDGIEKKSYERARCGASFEDLLSRLELFRKYKKNIDSLHGLDYCMQMVITKDNYSDLPFLPDFLKKYAIDRVQLLPLNDTINVKNSFYKDSEIKFRLRESLKNLEEETEKSGIKLINALPVSMEYEVPENSTELRKNEISNPPFCLWPWQQLSMYAEGGVTVHCFCVHITVGNTNDNTLSEIWNGAAIKELRSKIINSENETICNSSCLDGSIDRRALQLDF